MPSKEDGLREMMSHGVSTTDAHMLKDMTELAMKNALEAIQMVADRSPAHLRLPILIGGLGSLAALLKRLSPITFDQLNAMTAEDYENGGLSVLAAKIDV